MYENVKLTREEQEIENEIEKGKYESVDNFDEWKDILKAAAVRTIEKIEKNRLIANFKRPDLKKQAVKLLKEKFGNDVEVF